MAIELDGETIPSNDLGVWPDQIAGDGVASAVVPPLGDGEHEPETVAASCDSETTRTAIAIIKALDVGSVEISGGLSIATVRQEGLVSERVIAVPLWSATDETCSVQVECDLVSDTLDATLTCSAVVTLTPEASQVATIPAVADRLVDLGGGSVEVAAVRVLAADPILGYAEPGAAAIPLAVSEPGASFVNDVSSLALADCRADVVGGELVAGRSFTVTGTVVNNANPIDGVRYSMDDGATWYESEAVDAAWGGSAEEFVVDASVAGPGRYIMMIEPVSNGIPWGAGCEVRVETADSSRGGDRP